MRAYEGFIENGKVYPVGVPFPVTSRQRVIITILDEALNAEKLNKTSDSEYLTVVDELFGSINDSTFIPPSEVPWDVTSPREEII